MKKTVTEAPFVFAFVFLAGVASPLKAQGQLAKEGLERILEAKEAAIAKKSAAQDLREAARKIELKRAQVQEAMRKMPASPTEQEVGAVAWDFADAAERNRARAATAELEGRLNGESEQIAAEEKLPEECKPKLSSQLKDVACYCLRTRSNLHRWPTEEELLQFAMNKAAGEAMDCLNARVIRRIARASNETVAAIVGPPLKKAGQALVSRIFPEPSSSPSPADTEQDLEILLLMHCVCGGK